MGAELRQQYTVPLPGHIILLAWSDLVDGVV